MLVAGEDPIFLLRRLVRFSSEDIGMADPNALLQALAGWDSFLRLGSPEGELAIAQVVLYLASAPKSNSVYRAFSAATAAATAATARSNNNSNGGRNRNNNTKNNGNSRSNCSNNNNNDEEQPQQ